VEEFKYFGVTLILRNSSQEEFKEQVDVGECLLSFGAEYFATQKLKNQMIFPVLYGCGSRSLTLREECRLKFENRMLRMFAPKRDEVTGEWKYLHNVELNDMYFSPSIVCVMKSRRMRWAGM
jgi:hypothetical protein